MGTVSASPIRRSVDPSITRSRERFGVVGVSPAILTVTALIQAAIYLPTGSAALLATSSTTPLTR
jgi:hypothetical protein